MKILVFSDTHRNTEFMLEAIVRHKNETDMIIHLGDCSSDTSVLSAVFPHIACVNVRGNCDFGIFESRVQDEAVFKLPDSDFTLFACHGHRYSVKDGTDFLVSKAKALGASIALYGHTHIPDIEFKNGIYIINPGSTAFPRGNNPESYCVINIHDGKILPSIIYKN